VSILGDHATTLQTALGRLSELDDVLDDAARSIARSLDAGGKVLAAGNGGSAAEAQHLTAELLGRLHPARERGPLPAVALHADTSTITAVGNDYGYDEIFSRQVEALGRSEDALVVLSTSGASKNLVRAVETANRRGLVTVGLLGPGVRPLHETCTHVLAVPTDSLQAIQECHLVLVHVLVEQVEDFLAAAKSDAQVGNSAAAISTG
jgi:D-sedoheptulose 7-phosphate isomerase